MRWFFLTLLLFSPLAMSYDMTISWSRTTTTESGLTLDPDIIVYELYIAENGGEYYQLAETPDDIFVNENVVPGCYDVYAKSVRTDSGQRSVSSEIASICFEDDAGGDEGNDQGDSESDGGLVLPPLPPGMLQITIE